MKAAKKTDYLFYALVLFIAASAIYFYIEGQVNPVRDIVKRKLEISVLFVFYEAQKPVMVSYFMQNMQTNRGVFFDIPTNTAIKIPSRKRIDRLATVFRPQAPQNFVQQVMQQLDLKQIPFYILINLEELSFWVDILGGIEIFMPSAIKRMQNGEEVLFSSGSFIMDGAKTRDYLLLTEDQENNARWRERRRLFMVAFIKRLVEHTHTLSYPHIVKKLHQYCITNLRGDALQSLFDAFGVLDVENMGYQPLVGSVRLVDGTYLVFPNYEGYLLRETVKRASSALANTTQAGQTFLPSKIEIQNGTTNNGLGYRTANLFTSLGYEVSAIKNAAEITPYTIVIDLNDNLETAQKIADTIHATRVYSLALAQKDDASLPVDVRIILGNDFDGRYVRSSQAP